MAHNLRFCDAITFLNGQVHLALQFIVRPRLCVGHLNIQCGQSVFFHLSSMHTKTLEEDSLTSTQLIINVALYLDVIREASCNWFTESGWPNSFHVTLLPNIAWVCSPGPLRLPPPAFRTPDCLLLSPTKAMGFQQPDCRYREYLQDRKYAEAPAKANGLCYRLQSCNERSGKKASDKI